MHLTTALNPGQFQGEQVYRTICGRCNNQSDRASDYLEIEVNIEVLCIRPLSYYGLCHMQKNGATLEDRLAVSLKAETLSGDNA